MRDAILFSANLSMVDIDDAQRHLDEHSELYWSVMFRINAGHFSFPILGFIHISGRQVEYRAVIGRIIPFSADVFKNPLAERVKPLSFRELWENDPRGRARPWKNDLVFTEISPFSFDTLKFEKYPSGSGMVTHPPQNYIRVIPPDQPPESGSTPEIPPSIPQSTRPAPPTCDQYCGEESGRLRLGQLDTIESGLRLEGRQVHTPAGRIDLLCRDQRGNYVIVELKRMRGSDQVIGQILRYMGWARGAYPRSNVRGIVTVQHRDTALDYAVRAVPDILVKEFSLSIR
jgi:Endonuclease NucS